MYMPVQPATQRFRYFISLSVAVAEAMRLAVVSCLKILRRPGAHKMPQIAAAATAGAGGVGAEKGRSSNSCGSH